MLKHANKIIKESLESKYSNFLYHFALLVFKSSHVLTKIEESKNLTVDIFDYLFVSTYFEGGQQNDQRIKISDYFDFSLFF